MMACANKGGPGRVSLAVFPALLVIVLLSNGVDAQQLPPGGQAQLSLQAMSRQLDSIERHREIHADPCCFLPLHAPRRMYVFAPFRVGIELFPPLSTQIQLRPPPRSATIRFEAPNGVSLTYFI